MRIDAMKSAFDAAQRQPGKLARANTERNTERNAVMSSSGFQPSVTFAERTGPQSSSNIQSVKRTQPFTVRHPWALLLHYNACRHVLLCLYLLSLAD